MSFSKVVPLKHLMRDASPDDEVCLLSITNEQPEDAASLRSGINAGPDPRYSFPSHMMAGLAKSLRANRSTGIKIIGDSLGNGADEYVRLFADHIIEEFPNWRVISRDVQTNASKGSITMAETVLQAASGERHWFGPNQRAQHALVTGAAGTTPTSSGDITLTVTASGMTNSPKAVNVAVTSGDSIGTWLQKCRVSLAADPDVSAFFDIGGEGTILHITKKTNAANDATLNLAITGGSTGITSRPTSDFGVRGPHFKQPDFAIPASGSFSIDARISKGATTNNIYPWAFWGGTTPELQRQIRMEIYSGGVGVNFYDRNGTYRSPSWGGADTHIPSDNTPIWTRIYFNTAGASGYTEVSFWTSTTGEAGSWTQRGSTWSAGADVGITPFAGGYCEVGGVGLYFGYGLGVYSLRMSKGFGDEFTFAPPIDSASKQSGSNTVELRGSPTLVLDNYSYSGATSATLLDHINGTLQVETATAAGTVSGSGDATVTLTSALLSAPEVLSVAVTNGDTAAVWAEKVRVALRANSNVSTHYTVSGSQASATIILTAKVARANDSTLNLALANGTSTGITTAATSANTTTGYAPFANTLLRPNGDSLIIFAGGMNDNYAGLITAGREYSEAAAAIINKLKETSTRAFPVMLATNPRSEPAGLEDTTENLEQKGMLARELAIEAQSRGWGFIDFYNALKDSGYDLNVNIPDGVHPNATLNAITSGVLIELLDSAL